MGGFPFNADGEGYLTLKVPKLSKDMAFIVVTEDYADIVRGVFQNPKNGIVSVSKASPRLPIGMT